MSNKKTIIVTQKKSPIGRQSYQRKTLIGLGLNKIGRSKELEDWISFVKPISDKDIGSSIKFCYLAEGKVDFYPRTSPTMEWDTCASQIIVEESGGEVLIRDKISSSLFKKILKTELLL